MVGADLLPQRLARLQRAASHRVSGLRIVLDNLSDVGNKAAVLRTAESFGILNVHIITTPNTAAADHAAHRQRWLKNTRRPVRSVTTGADKWLKVHHHLTAQECVDELRKDAFRLLCAKPEAPEQDVVRSDVVPLHHVDFSLATALVFGNEKCGVSRDMSSLSDGDFTIPMVGLTESLNISVAAGICMHWGRLARLEALDRVRGGGVTSDMGGEDQVVLLEHYASINRLEKERKAGIGREERKQIQEEMATRFPSTRTSKFAE